MTNHLYRFASLAVCVMAVSLFSATPATAASSSLPRLTANLVSLPSVGGRVQLRVWSPQSKSCKVEASPTIPTSAGIYRCVRGISLINVSLPSNNRFIQVSYGINITEQHPNVTTKIVRVIVAAAALPTATGPQVASESPSVSTVWSGYVDVAPPAQKFSFVYGQWVIPTVTCTATEATSTEWVGIDGEGGSTVEQVGTNADCIGGAPSYSAWVEMFGDQQFYGNYPEELAPGGSSAPYPVHAGDAMAAYVSAPGAIGGSPDSWTLAISDSTAGWSDAVDVPLPPTPPAQFSAEWIIERGGDPVTEFAPVTFTDCTTILAGVVGTISAAASIPMPLVTNPENTADLYPTVTLVTPGALNATGSSFTDTWVTPGFNEWPSIISTSLSPAYRGESNYSQTLSESGGFAPYTWSISKGRLPTGLSLDSTTGSITGVVGGSAVSETFTVLITDAYGGTDTKTFSIHLE
jgi:hypothetical protein